MAEGFILSESDARILKSIVTQFQRRFRNTSGRGNEGSIDHQEHQAPEVYIARAPSVGISGLDENTTGTGTSALVDDAPGSATCQIYRILNEDGTETLEKVHNLTAKVYNLSTAVISGNSWMVCIRDKFGKYFAIPTTVIQLDDEIVECQERVILVECVDGFIEITYEYDYYSADGRKIITNTTPCDEDSGEVGTSTSTASNSCGNVQLTLSAILNGSDCTVCDQLNNGGIPYTLIALQGGICSWEYQGLSVSCATSTISLYWDLSTNSWLLIIAGDIPGAIATFHNTTLPSTWNGESSMTMTLLSYSGHCSGWPLSLIISPV